MSETLTIIGPSGSSVSVDSNALSVRPQSDFQKAIEDGDAYSWSTLTYDMTAKDTILAVQNNSSTRDLHIERILLQSDTATQFIVHTAANTTPAAGGAAVTAVNLNRNSGNTASATAFTNDATNAAADSYTYRIYTGLCAADGNVDLPVGGALIIPNGCMVGVDLTANAGACNVTIIGYYKDR